MALHLADLPAAGEWLLPPGILLVVGSHGFPPTQARFNRAAEIARELCLRQGAPEIVVLAERAFEPFEADAARALGELVSEIEVLAHPEAGSRVQRLLARTLARGREALAGAPPPLGGRQHAPPRLLRLLRARRAERQYRAVIACGVHLAPVLSHFPPWTEKLIDLGRIGSDAHRSHSLRGRADALEVFADGEAELSLLAAADGVIVTSVADAVRLRELRFQRDLVLFPPTGLLGFCGPRREGDENTELERPPRILCVASETPANLDGLRWFRRQVYPTILRFVPTCRLRIVGEAARHIEPGPGVDRIGRLDRLDVEYSRATVVALPLRMGSGIRRRAVEALARGKALVTTSVGAYGAGLEPGKDAVIADGEEALAVQTAEVLASDARRLALERRALEVARERFDPARTFRPLAERLWLPAERPEVKPAGAALPADPARAW
jgi:glycosyltransferase involved in cell wall biosynthesis